MPNRIAFMQVELIELIKVYSVLDDSISTIVASFNYLGVGFASYASSKPRLIVKASGGSLLLEDGRIQRVVIYLSIVVILIK